MLIFFAVLIGVLCGVLVPQNLPPSFTPFLAIGLLAACNTLFGGIAAQVHRKFDVRAFVFGFFINTILAMVLTFAGVKLGVDFSLAAIVYFGTRIFNNLAKIQHSILQKNGNGVKIKEIGDKPLLQLKKFKRTFPPDGSGDDDNTKQDTL
ncbi:MAG: small basic family protein [Intestinibacillus sp.]